MSKLANISLGEPIELGEVVGARLGQAAAIGINPHSGKPEVYFAANGSPATFYVADPETGEPSFQFDIPHSESIWAMTAAPDGNVYFAATEDGRLYRYEPAAAAVECLGDIPGDPWIWDLKSAPDGCVYGVSYPRAKAFEYNPATGQFRDLGRMSEHEQYARGVAASQHEVYAGIGTTARLVSVSRTDGTRRELHLEGYTSEQGFIDRIWMYGDHMFVSANQSRILVYNPDEQRIIASLDADDFIGPASPQDGRFYYVYAGGLYAYCPQTCQSTQQAELPPMEDRPKIKAMLWAGTRAQLIIVTSSADVLIYDPASRSVRVTPLQLPLKPVTLQSLESDGQGKLYIGGYHRSLTVYDTRERRIDIRIPKFPQTEGIGFLNGNVYFGTYTKAKLFKYNPNQPLDPSLQPTANPAMALQIGHGQDRPFSFAAGDNKLFVGTIPDYGLLTGALTVYDEQTDEWNVYTDLVPNQSIIGLAYRDGLLYGGTSNWGGLGIEPTETKAELFVWDVASRKLLNRFTPDIPGIDMPPRMIGELTFGPDGKLWGAADGTIFAICPHTLQVVKSKMICPSEYKYTKIRPYFLRWGADGLLFTTLARKLIVIDTDSLEHVIMQDEPLALMTLGADGHVYYNDGSRLLMREVVYRQADARS